MNTTPKKSKIICMIAAFFCVAAIVAVNIVLDGRRGSGTPKDTSAEATSAESTAATETTVMTETMTEETTAPEVPTDPEPEPEPIEPEPEPEPIEPEPEPEPEPIEPVYTPPGTEYVIPDGRDTNFAGTLFIGDSRTEGLMLYSGVSGASAYAVRGLNVDSFFSLPAVNLGGQKLTVADALAAEGGGFPRIIITLGINELGWVNDSAFRDHYARVLEYVREVCPAAQVYIQTLIPVTATRSAADGIFNNVNIARYNDIIRALAAEMGVGLIDAAAQICPEGALPEDGASDGIHLKKPYCQRWLDVIKEIVG